MPWLAGKEGAFVAKGCCKKDPKSNTVPKMSEGVSFSETGSYRDSTIYQGTNYSKLAGKEGAFVAKGCCNKDPKSNTVPKMSEGISFSETGSYRDSTIYQGANYSK